MRPLEAVDQCQDTVSVSPAGLRFAYVPPGRRIQHDITSLDRGWRLRKRAGEATIANTFVIAGYFYAWLNALFSLTVKFDLYLAAVFLGITPFVWDLSITL